jgi:hypothetical protein
MSKMSLHDTFLRSFLTVSEGGIAKAVTQMLVQKVAAKGIVLTKKQQARILAGVRAKRIDASLFPKTKRSIRIAFTKRDIAKVERMTNRALALLPALVHEESTTIAAESLPRLRERWPERAHFEEGRRRSFEQDVTGWWQSPLDNLGMMLTISNELTTQFADEARRTGRTSALRSALFRLQVRACQLGYEIRTLLAAGLPDAAYGRWRTLHEVAITALYMRERGEMMAERYLAHHVVEAVAAAESWNRHRRRLKTRSVPIASVRRLQAKKAALVQRFGSNYEEAYGWAAENTSEKIRSFAVIEARVDMEHWRPFYKAASLRVHASPHALFNRFSSYKSEVLIAGPSVFGLADAGQGVAISLNQITSAVASLEDVRLDTLVTLKVLNQLGLETIDAFVTAQRQLEAAEDRRRRRNQKARSKRQRRART